MTNFFKYHIETIMFLLGYNTSLKKTEEKCQKK